MGTRDGRDRRVTQGAGLWERGMDGMGVAQGLVGARGGLMGVAQGRGLSAVIELMRLK